MTFALPAGQTVGVRQRQFLVEEAISPLACDAARVRLAFSENISGARPSASRA